MDQRGAGPYLLLTIASILPAQGCSTMTKTVEAEANRLYGILDSREVMPGEMEPGFPDYSIESKNAVVERVAKLPKHEAKGWLLARLPIIRTNQNEATMGSVFETNLDSPDPAARRASLYGLEKLEHPQLTQLALPLLRDEDDTVLYAACHVLLPPARSNWELWQKLQEVYRAHKGDEKFHMSMGLLEAHDIGRTSQKRKRLGEE